MSSKTTTLSTITVTKSNNPFTTTIPTEPIISPLKTIDPPSKDTLSIDSTLMTTNISDIITEELGAELFDFYKNDVYRKHRYTSTSTNKKPRESNRYEEYPLASDEMHPVPTKATALIDIYSPKFESALNVMNQHPNAKLVSIPMFKPVISTGAKVWEDLSTPNEHSKMDELD